MALRGVAGSTGGGSNVVGPASSTNNAIVRFDGTTGKLIKDGTSTIDDSGNMVVTGTGSFGGALNLNSHLINNVTDPASAQDAATKNYVDSLVQGLSPKQSAKLATAAALPSNVYNNGASGVGATLTGVATGVLTVDSVAVALNDRIVVKNEAAPANNGVYLCTIAGAVGVAYVLTRTTDADTSAELDGAFVFIESGTVNSATGWVIANSSTITIGTTAINWTQFSGAGTYTAGNGLTLTGSAFSIDTAITVDKTTVQTLSNKTLVTPAITTSTTITGGSISASAPALNITQTWNNAGVTFNGMLVNITDTASNSASTFVDFQLGGTSKCNIGKQGINLQAGATYGIGGGVNGFLGSTVLALPGVGGKIQFSGTSNAGNVADTTISRGNAAATIQHGGADAAAPVAQTISTQNVVAGTSNTNGVNLTIAPGQGTGTGTGGSLIVQVAPAGSTGSTQNALVTALTIDSTKAATFADNILMASGKVLSWNADSGISRTGTGTLAVGNASAGNATGTLVAGTFGIGSGASGWWEGSNGLRLPNNLPFAWAATTNAATTADTFLTRGGAATLRLGSADAAAPVAQTLTAQSVVAGTADTAGPNLTYDAPKGTGTGVGGAHIFRVAPASTTGSTQNALAAALTIGSDRSTTLAGGTVTANTPLLNMTQTWNSSGVTFNGMLLNVTSTASAAASLLLNLQVGGATQFSVRKDGLMTAAFAVVGGGSTGTNICFNHGGVALAGDSFISFASPGASIGTTRAILIQDANYILALRNLTNPHTFRVYNTFTDASNYERGIFDWTTNANVLTVGTENAGTGSARNLQVNIGGTKKLDYGVTNASLWTFASGIVGTTATMTGNLTLGASATSLYDATKDFLGIGTTSPAARLHVTGNISAAAWTTAGIQFRCGGAGVTLTDTTSSGTVATTVCSGMGSPTLAASSSTTYTDATILSLGSGPIAGTNVTITNAYSLTAVGNVRLDSKTGLGLGAVPTAFGDFGASTTSNASLRIRSGTAPTSPNDGDMWYDGTNVKFRVGGSTKTFTLV